jgi:Chemotaxis phosphatase CheX
MKTSPVDEWSDAAIVSTGDVVSQLLGWDLSRVEHSPGFGDGPMCGAYVPLSSADSVLQIGLVTDRTGCEAISRALLAMEATEAFASPGDVADAFGEIANMVAGGVKSRMNDRMPSLRLGLPLFVDGRVVQAAAEQRTTELLLGTVRTSVVVLRLPIGGPSRFVPRSAR